MVDRRGEFITQQLQSSQMGENEVESFTIQSK